ncbi:TRAP transporter large permease subunit [Roseivivax sp. CAU 1761]
MCSCDRSQWCRSRSSCSPSSCPACLAAIYALYFYLRALTRPALAPAYEGESLPLSQRLLGTLRLIPLLLLMVIVTGSIFLGIATPTEAAARGVAGAAVTVGLYGRLTLPLLRDAAMSTVTTTSMILLIIVGSSAFSQLLAGSQVIRGLLDAVLMIELTPLLFVVIAMGIVMFLGCNIGGVSIMMITIPVFYPIIKLLGIDPIWFSVLLLIQIELATITPPFGFLLFVLQGVQPELHIQDIYRAVLPIMLMQTALFGLLILAPSLTSLLPDLMIQN